MKVRKIAFTGSTLVGRKILENSAKSNLKKGKFLNYLIKIISSIRIRR
jgi:hypothetical protein